MKSIRGMLGMRVVMDAKKLGHVAQVRISRDITRMEGVWLDAGLAGARYIPSEHISMLGSVAVIVDAVGKRLPVCQKSLLRRVVSTGGCRLGIAVDAWVDEQTFAVEAITLSKSFWDDILHGRETIAHFHVDDGNNIVADEESEVDV